MGFFQSMKKRLADRKKIKVTPEILGQGLVLQASDHLWELCELSRKPDIFYQIDDSKVSPIFKELFNFYFSLFSYAPLFNEMSVFESNIFGRQLLEEAFKALSGIPINIDETMLDESFMEIFDKDLRFYYHDQIPEDEKEELHRVMHFCKGEEGEWSDNWLGYLAVKLHYRLCKILNISLEDNFISFIGLYIFNMTTVTSFYTGVLKKIKSTSSYGQQ